MMMVAASIGFAGTHSISAILGGIPGVYVAHGTQNFEERGPIGVNSQTPEDFLASMREMDKDHTHAIAIHTNFPPSLFKPLCESRGVEYTLIVRNPYRQIKSCYYWALNKLLTRGDLTIMERMHLYARHACHTVAPTLPNALYLFALNHVVPFNLQAVLAGAPVMRMEQLLESEAYFKSAFHLPDDIVIGHFDGHEIRKKSHAREAESFGVGEPDIETIHRISAFQTPQGLLDLPAYAEKLGYPPEPA